MVSRMLDLVIQRLHVFPYISHTIDDGVERDHPIGRNLAATEQPDNVVYYLEILSNLLNINQLHASAALKTRSVQKLRTQEQDQPQPVGGKEGSTNKEHDAPAQIWEHLSFFCTLILRRSLAPSSDFVESRAVRWACVRLFQTLIENMDAESTPFPDFENLLIKSLIWSIESSETYLQTVLIQALQVLLEKKSSAQGAGPTLLARQVPKEDPGIHHQRNSFEAETEKLSPAKDHVTPETALLDCLILGLGSLESHTVLEPWVRFLEFVLPYSSTNIFQTLLPLVDCLSTAISNVFDGLQASFSDPSTESPLRSEPIQSLNLLFNALEFTLAKGHDQITRDEAKKLKLPEPSQGYFGNMVTGLFSAEVQASRPITANDRLSVLLCFRDAVKISYRIWAWDADRNSLQSTDPTIATTFNYTSVRLRNRTRRALEHLLAAEPLECLEVLVEIWTTSKGTSMIMDLLHTLEASRPKITMPTIFNALYSRTNPSVLDTHRQSTLTSELSDIQIATFLVFYTQSMDDDALDEVWVDCMTFSRDILANPMPQRQILPLLLEFLAVLGEKIDNTNFGEQRRMRREIGVGIKFHPSDLTRLMKDHRTCSYDYWQRCSPSDRSHFPLM